MQLKKGKSEAHGLFANETVKMGQLDGPAWGAFGQYLPAMVRFKCGATAGWAGPIASHPTHPAAARRRLPPAADGRDLEIGEIRRPTADESRQHERSP